MHVEKLEYIIWAQDMDRAVQFYRDVFDAVVVRRSDVMAAHPARRRAGIPWTSEPRSSSFFAALVEMNDCGNPRATRRRRTSTLQRNEVRNGGGVGSGFHTQAPECIRVRQRQPAADGDPESGTNGAVRDGRRSDFRIDHHKPRARRSGRNCRRHSARRGSRELCRRNRCEPERLPRWLRG